MSLGARYSGIGLGLWGGVGLALLIATGAGGIDFLVRLAERVIRANPKYVTIVAP